MSQTVDEEEHSIEMHLPYVAKVMESRRGHYTIVPILVGALSEEKEILYGKLLSKYLADPENLFVISSDFCHWGERDFCHYYVTGNIKFMAVSLLLSQGSVSGTPTTIRRMDPSMHPLRSWTLL